MIEKSKYCSDDVMKKYGNKEPMMTKEDNENFENSTKCWICNDCIDTDVKVRDHCQITGKYGENIEVPHIEIIIINIKLNHKILVIFHNLRNYDSHLIMQELGKFNLKINVIVNGL